jgi:hypothetical protein
LRPLICPTAEIPWLTAVELVCLSHGDQASKWKKRVELWSLVASKFAPEQVKVAVSGRQAIENCHRTVQATPTLDQPMSARGK